jgi:hypothetical protein
MMDVVPVVERATPKRFVLKRAPVLILPARPSAMERNAETMGVEVCVASAAMGIPVNPMACATPVHPPATVKSVEQMDVEVPVESVPWEAVAVLRVNACAHRTARGKNAEMMDVEDCAGPVVEANFAPHLAHVLPVSPTAWENSAGTMDAEETAEPVLMVSPVVGRASVDYASPIVQGNTVETTDVAGYAAPAPPVKPVEINFSVSPMTIVFLTASPRNVVLMGVQDSVEPVLRISNVIPMENV